MGIDFDTFMHYNSVKQHSSTDFMRILCIIYITYYVIKEIQIMSENETMLIDLIRNHKNPDKAFVTAIEIILVFLNHHEASVSESSAVFQESV